MGARGGNASSVRGIALFELWLDGASYGDAVHASFQPAATHTRSPRVDRMYLTVLVSEKRTDSSACG